MHAETHSPMDEFGVTSLKECGWGPLDLMLLPGEYVRVYAPGGSNMDDRGLSLKCVGC